MATQKQVQEEEVDVIIPNLPPNLPNRRGARVVAKVKDNKEHARWKPSAPCVLPQGRTDYAPGEEMVGNVAEPTPGAIYRIDGDKGQVFQWNKDDIGKVDVTEV